MHPEQQTEVAAIKARRHFLATCGKFAVVTPPAITVLLAATERYYAAFGSGGPGGQGGGGSLQIAQAIGNGLTRHPDESANKPASAPDFYRAFTDPATKDQKLPGEKIVDPAQPGHAVLPQSPQAGHFRTMRRSADSTSPGRSSATRT